MKSAFVLEPIILTFVSTTVVEQEEDLGHSAVAVQVLTAEVAHSAP